MARPLMAAAAAFALIAAFPLMLAPAQALAGPVVDLRPGAQGHAGAVTLGDLFDAATGPAGTVVVGHAAPGDQAVLDAGQVQIAAHAAGVDWRNAGGLRRIIVPVSADPAPDASGADGPAPSRRRHARAEQTLVYAHNLMAGDVLQADDLEWSDAAIALPDGLRGPEAAIGKAVRLPLRAGQAVAIRDLVSPKVVHRNETISVDFSSAGVSVSLEGRAMNDAAAGDPVEVMNLASKKLIEAVATGPGHAAVGPTADAARADPAGSGGLRRAALP